MPDCRSRDGSPGGLHLHPRRVFPGGLQPPGGHQPGVRGGPHRKERLQFGLRLRRLHAPRSRSLHLRRRDGAHRVSRGQGWQTPAQASLPCGHWRVRLPHHRGQRRDGGVGAGHLPQGWQGLVCLVWSREQPRDQALLHLRQREQAVRCRGGNVHPAARASGEALRWRRRRVGQPSGRDPRRILRPGAPEGHLRRRAHGL
mmetsp:Transcript_34053/g.89417  ORF Transcript_34053/g.89417 Transcript_34053/m.89417 type:complete len:200 (+) Transcript_34053:450-1049(+)